MPVTRAQSKAEGVHSLTQSNLNAREFGAVKKSLRKSSLSDQFSKIIAHARGEFTLSASDDSSSDVSSWRSRFFSSSALKTTASDYSLSSFMTNETVSEVGSDSSEYACAEAIEAEVVTNIEASRDAYKNSKINPLVMAGIGLITAAVVVYAASYLGGAFSMGVNAGVNDATETMNSDCMKDTFGGRYQKISGVFYSALADIIKRVI